MRFSTVERARATHGMSDAPIYRMVTTLIAGRKATGSLVDFGCGTVSLTSYLQVSVTSYRGVDAVRFDGFPADASFLQADLDQVPWPIPEASADIAVAVESIEHLENP